VTRTPYCKPCDRFFRYGPVPWRCPSCDGLLEIRDVQFESSCQAMPQDSNQVRRLSQQLRHARARA